jgi:hypothetical protein
MSKLTPEPHVGIFWFYRGRLLKSAVSVVNGLPYGDAVHSQTDHVTFWPEVQRRIRKLQHVEYEEVPRGRIVYHRSESRYCVYMDRKLHKPRIKQLLLREFSLPKRFTSFLTDPHYTTDADELARLF